MCPAFGDGMGSGRAERDNAPMRLMSLLLLLCITWPSSADAQWLSWPPKSDASPTSDASVRGTLAPVRLRISGQDGIRQLWVDNDLSGPVEVRVSSAARASGLPVQRLLPTRGSHRLAQFDAPIRLRLQLEAVPGVPGAHAQDVTYTLPLQLPQLRIGQLPEGRFSHSDEENRHAIDFAAPFGTPVLAARAGTVMQVAGEHADAPGRLKEANFVRILHADGSMAVYAHLQRGSLEVVPSQRVETGQVLARSGNSGYSSGPHLHFAVQVNAGMRLRSVPVRLVGPLGELRLPREADASSPL